MSQQTPLHRITVPDIKARKGKDPIVCLTCYHAHTARLLDEHVDLILVGDTLGMVIHGMDNTLGVTLDMMILHGQAVMRGAKKALVVVDMPFGSYEESPQVAFRNAVPRAAGNRLRGGEAGGRRAHGGDHPLPDPARHSGGRPCRHDAANGPRPGRVQDAGPRRGGMAAIEADARAVADAGAFAVVLEAMAEPLAAKITREVPIPTIGIGASPDCDGQILVMEDMLGLNPNPPALCAGICPCRGRNRGGGSRLCRRRPLPPLPGKENVYAMRKGSAAS